MQQIKGINTMVDRVSFPNAIPNKDESRYYLPDNGSRLGGNITEESKIELRDDVENALEAGKFVLVKIRMVTNWDTGDFYHQFITRVLDIDDKFTYKMYKNVINFIDPYSDCMDNIFLTVLHKDQKVLKSKWKENKKKKEEEDKQYCDEFGYSY